MKTNSLWMVLLLFSGLIFTSCGGDEQSSETSESDTLSNIVTGNPAIDGLTKEIKQNPDNAALYAKRGRVFVENKGYDEAIIDFTYAVKLDSTNIDYYHLLADTYMDYFKSRKALQVMKQAAELFPNDLPTLLQLSEYQLILKQHEESMKTIDQVLKQDPQNATAYLMFGMNFKEQGDTVLAINSFQKAVEFDSDMIDAWVNLGQLYEAMDDPLAARYFDNAVRVAPNNIYALHAKADYHSNQDQLEEAIDAYRKIVRADPQYVDAYFNSGLIYLDMDSVQQASKQFDLALKVSPTHIQAYYFRGLSKEMMGDNAAAKADYEQALRMAPNYTRAQEGLKRLKEEG
jgi:tetratricopeptide (TPR) repeat protein